MKKKMERGSKLKIEEISDPNNREKDKETRVSLTITKGQYLNSIVLREKKGSSWEVFGKIVTANMSDWVKDMTLLVQEADWISNRMPPKNTFRTHNCASKYKRHREILETMRVKQHLTYKGKGLEGSCLKSQRPKEV